MRHAEKEQNGYYDAVERKTGKSPLDDKPEIKNYHHWYITVFSRLSWSRQVGMDYGPIKLSEIIKYWKDVERIEPLIEFIDIMQALDQVFMEYRKELRDNETGN